MPQEATRVAACSLVFAVARSTPARCKVGREPEAALARGGAAQPAAGSQ